MDFTFDENIFSDLHKDAFGFRPRNHRFYNTFTTDEQKQEDWDYVCKCLDAEIERADLAEIQCDIEFEQRIKNCIEYGADDRETAICWIFQSDKDFDQGFGFGYVQWKLGVSEKYRTEILEVIKNITSEV